MDAPKNLNTLGPDYTRLLGTLTSRITQASIQAHIRVNEERTLLYWEMGLAIEAQQKKQGWGASVIPKLSHDLQNQFPTMQGLSQRNLGAMIRFAREYGNISSDIGTTPIGSVDDPRINLQQLVAKLPWGHNIVLFEKVKDLGIRLFYAESILKNGWSRAVLIHQIESELHLRAENTDNNFKKTLPTPTSDLARELIKDNYNLEFLDIHESIKERELESSLIANLKDFLLELGVGFAFVGNQYRLEVGGQDYYLDLLFYHTRLHAYVVVELKVDSFKPEYAGKMNFYLSAVDDLLKSDLDEPAIGILLCKEKNKIIVDYALRNSNKPIAVSDYSLKRRLPKAYQGELPTISELKRGLTSL